MLKNIWRDLLASSDNLEAGWLSWEALTMLDGKPFSLLDPYYPLVI
jgi:hypothetical protein